ncbi:MAG TPA: P-II family nitrogen regulator [Firmicutes bacterium]|jgi:nitrogen regulatory protein P-II 1|nr:P-II family nitrogen regulator [Bacillota bacterium]
MATGHNHQLIVTIIDKGRSEPIIKASRAAGAEGGTVIYGRGIGIHERKMLLGIPIEPEKELVLTVIPRNLTEKVLTAIIEAGDLNKPGSGIAFVLDLDRVAGIAHLLQKPPQKPEKD